MQLVIGNKNYSSWSLRAWLFMQHHGLEFREVQVWLDTEEGDLAMQQLISNRKVPVLLDGKVAVWESYAIAEYLREKLDLSDVWPGNLADRAHARAMCLEMASSFFGVRTEMPMNLHRSPSPVTLSEAALADVARIDQLWSRYASDDYLFGAFGLVDAFFTPVATRFATYQVELPSEASRQYQAKLLSHPAFVQWRAEALEETAVIEHEEI